MDGARHSSTIRTPTIHPELRMLPMKAHSYSVVGAKGCYRQQSSEPSE